MLVSEYPGAWKQLVLAVYMKHLATKASYPTWLRIFQRKESFSVYSENWSFSDAVRDANCLFFSSLPLRPSDRVQITQRTRLCTLVLGIFSSCAHVLSVETLHPPPVGWGGLCEKEEVEL